MSKATRRHEPSNLLELHSVIKDDHTKVEAVTRVGFGRFLQLDIPSQYDGTFLSHLLQSFNPGTFTLDLPRGFVRVEDIDVRVVYGLPLGGKVIRERNPEVLLKNKWSEYHGERNPSIKKVIANLMAKDPSDQMWIYSYILVCTNICIRCTKFDNICLKVLSAIAETGDTREIRKLDWCGYVLECLSKSIKEYRKDITNPKRKDKVYFKGPTPFLMLFYIDRVQMGREMHCRTFPIVTAWNAVLIKKRIAMEMEIQSFGYKFGDGHILERIQVPVDDGQNLVALDDNENVQDENLINMPVQDMIPEPVEDEGQNPVEDEGQNPVDIPLYGNIPVPVDDEEHNLDENESYLRCLVDIALHESIPVPVEGAEHNLDHMALEVENVLVWKSSRTIKAPNRYTPSTRPEKKSRLAEVSRKKLIVLDVNGVLAHILRREQLPSDRIINPLPGCRHLYVVKRPHLDKFLEFCFEKFTVGVWSSRIERNLIPVVKEIFGGYMQKLAFVWDQTKCTKTKYPEDLLESTSDDKPLFLKELKKIWEKQGDNGLTWEKDGYNETNTILVDDSPAKSLLNPRYNAIFPHTSTRGNEKTDNSLAHNGDIRMYLEGLANAENVAEYVEQNPFGQIAISENHPLWPSYKKVLDL